MTPDPIKNLEMVEMFVCVDVMLALQAAIVKSAANQYFLEQKELFANNPVNTFPYIALRALEESAIVHIAEALKDEQNLRPLTTEIRRRAELISHRHAISHPITIEWRNPKMQAFCDAGRQYSDLRPALIWDMKRSIDDELRRMGREPKIAEVPIGEPQVMVLEAILHLSARDRAAIPPRPELLSDLIRFKGMFLDFLVQHPSGRRETTVTEDRGVED